MAGTFVRISSGGRSIARGIRQIDGARPSEKILYNGIELIVGVTELPNLKFSSRKVRATCLRRSRPISKSSSTQVLHA
jgi:hypothetical protein